MLSKTTKQGDYQWRAGGLRRIFSLVILTLCMAGCEPPTISSNGVIKAFGRVGLGPGDFSYPRAIAAEPDGSIFVIDKSGRIQRFSLAGDFETLWRMPEIDCGKPVGVSVHPDGRLFVADTHYSRVMIFDRDGNTLGSFGREGFGPGEFQLPTDVAFDADGFIYVVEYNGNDRVTKWTSDLRFVKAIGDTPVEGKRLRRPSAVAVDDEQTLWVTDACNHRVIRFSLDGEVLTTFGEFGDEPGQLRYPYDLSLSPDNTIMVCEYEGNRLQWFSKEGKSLRIWGSHGREPGELFSPWGATYGSDGKVFIVDSLNSRVQILKP